jgi:hypothetical protein
MDLDDLQQAIHSLYEGDTDTPSDGDDDYILRTRLINAAINRWENEKGVLWNELWVDLADAADGDKATTATTYKYDCPTDFKFPGGYVRTYSTVGNSTYYSVVPPEKFQLYDNEDKNIVTFIGNPSDGYDVKFLDTQSSGLTISYQYYKNADSLSLTSDIPEMSDPYFIVYYVLSRLYELDNRQAFAEKAFREAEMRLSQMRVKNMQPAFYQDSRIEDWATEQGLGGFGV